MPTKKKTPAKKRKPAAKKIDSEERHLLNLIVATERNITGQSESLDELFTKQAERIRKQLKDYRESK